MFRKLNITKIQFSIILLILIYVTGFIGIVASKNPIDFLSLTPLNLGISAILLFINHEKGFRNQVFIFILIAILGYFVEVLGVNTGAIFGEYAYGKTLGWKVFETPLMIGVNWILLTYATVYSLEKYIQTKWILALFSSLVLVSLDFLIEPIAITYDFWTWTNAQIPVQNYVAWYFIAVVFCFALAHFKRNSLNKFAPFLLFIQFLFFVILNFTN